MTPLIRARAIELRRADTREASPEVCPLKGPEADRGNAPVLLPARATRLTNFPVLSRFA